MVLLTNIPVFARSPDGRKVCCKLCHPEPETSEWIQKESWKPHTKTRSHEMVVQHRNMQQVRLEGLNRRLNAQDLGSSARHASLRRVQLPGLVSDFRDDGEAKTRKIGAAEARMWEAFDYDDIMPLTAGNDPEAATSTIQAELRRQTDSFGVWDSAQAAQQLGFGDGARTAAPDMSEGDVEDELFAEFLHNACTLRYAELFDISSKLIFNTDSGIHGQEAGEDVDIELDGQSSSSARTDGRWAPYGTKVV